MSTPGNKNGIFFRVDKTFSDEFYGYKAGEWKDAGGDFMNDATKQDILDYFKEVAPDVKVEFKDEVEAEVQAESEFLEILADAAPEDLLALSDEDWAVVSVTIQGHDRNFNWKEESSHDLQDGYKAVIYSREVRTQAWRDRAPNKKFVPVLFGPKLPKGGVAGFSGEKDTEVGAIKWAKVMLPNVLKDADHYKNDKWGIS